MSKLLLNNLRKVSYFIFWGWLFAPAISISQIPSGYYNTAENKSDQALRSALHDIIDDHIDYPYTSGSTTDTWDILKDSDADPNNVNNVILIYTRESVDGPQESEGWNREHVWAKSRGDFGTSRPMGTDVHNLRACNSNVNSTRSNYSFDDCPSSSCNEIYGNSYSSSALVFEPRDEDKGDVARTIFYMVVRYEGDSGEEDLEMTESILSSSSKSPRHGVRSTLLEWHEQDPVDDFERNRNNVIYSYQGNRNPFIDHPELVGYIWGNQQQEPWNSSLSSETIFFSEYAEGSLNNKYMEIYNPTNATINLSGYAWANVSNDQEIPETHEFWNNFPSGAQIAPGGLYIIASEQADSYITNVADYTTTYLFNGDDAYALVRGTETSYSVIDVVGMDFTKAGYQRGPWDVAGIANATKDHTLVRKATVTSGNAGDWASSSGTNVDNSEWIVLDIDDWSHLNAPSETLTISNLDELDVSIYPNPIRNSFLEISPSINANSIELYNVQGKRISQSSGTVERLEMPMTSGIYFLRFVFDQSVVNKRIVVKAP